MAAANAHLAVHCKIEGRKEEKDGNVGLRFQLYLSELCTLHENELITFRFEFRATNNLAETSDGVAVAIFRPLEPAVWSSSISELFYRFQIIMMAATAY